MATKPIVPFAVVEYHGVPIRIVAPYMYELSFKYKPDGTGMVKTLWDFLRVEVSTSSEGLLTEEQEVYLNRAMTCGLIKVNGELVHGDYVLKRNDTVFRLWHRHEPPVLFVPISEIVVLETDELIVCNKPSTIPVHSSGDYRLQSLLHILGSERGDLGPLFNVHRIDRLTSGLVVLARSSEAAKRLSDAIQGRASVRVRKTYVARVHGRFPSDKEDAKRCKGVVRVTESPSHGCCIEVSIRLASTDAQLGAHGVDEENGKECVSEFQFLAYDEKSTTSLVKCEPVTGRTHQLRLHLQAMGFPIENDPDYGWEAKASRSLVLDEAFSDICVTALRDAIQHKSESESEILALEMCVACKVKMEPPRHLGLYLHSCRYRFYENSKVVRDFRVPLPPWCFEMDSVWAEM